ncbi:MAG: flagellar basal body rod protein FlgC [Balneolaceae bacterium]|nr:flagellar basal body rod protein FlgC [Balneolaceae bacterium]
MLPDRLSSTFQTAAQGLALQRERLAVASRNIANAQTSAPEGSPNVYRPQRVKTLAPDQKNFLKVLSESVTSMNKSDPRHSAGAKQTGLGPSFEVAETEKFRYEYDPGHPDADENGMVRYPDVDMVREMAEMVSANRLYEANLSSIEAEKQMIKHSLEI